MSRKSLLKGGDYVTGYVSHPDSAALIFGSPVPIGTDLTEKDYYPSSDGTWQPCPCVGAVHRASHMTWVRLRQQTISRSAYGLLQTIAAQKLFLIFRQERGNTWGLIPSPQWRYDTRMDWRCLDQAAAAELVMGGFVIPARSCVFEDSYVAPPDAMSVELNIIEPV